MISPVPRTRRRRRVCGLYPDASELILRYTIDGRHRSNSFRTRVGADRYRGTLLQAVQEGGRFDEATGEPEAWLTPLAHLGVHEWCRRPYIGALSVMVR
jgi:hypothetical protein